MPGNINKVKEILTEESRKITEETREKTLGYIEAGLGIVAGLAWNEAVKGLIEYIFPLNKNSILAKFIYAVIMTLIVVVMTIYLSKIFKKGRNQ